MPPVAAYRLPFVTLSTQAVRQGLNARVPGGRYYDVTENRLYSRLGTIPSNIRRESVIFYNRIWRGISFDVPGAVAGTTQTTVRIPTVLGHFPANVQWMRVLLGGEPMVRYDSVALRSFGGGEVVDLHPDNVRDEFFNYVRTQLRQAKNYPFFRTGNNVRFRVSFSFFLPLNQTVDLDHLGDPRPIRTAFRMSLESALESAFEQLEAVSYFYGGQFAVAGIEITRKTTPEGFGQGGFRSLQQVSKVWIKPFVFTKFNCMFVACALHKQVQMNSDALLQTDEQHRVAGENLKKRMRRQNCPHVHDGYSDFNTLHSISDYLRLPVKVYDNTFGVIHQYTPPAMRMTGRARGVIELYYQDSHYSPLIRKQGIPENILESFEAFDSALSDLQMGDPSRAARMRKTFEKLALGEAVKIRNKFEEATDESAFRPDEIVAWDLETSPLVVLNAGIERKVHKAYLSGLAYYDSSRRLIVRQFEGHQCCQDFLSFVANNIEVFAGRTFYAHAGGRFDLPILLREGVFSKWSGSGSFQICPFRIVEGQAMELNGSWISFGLELRKEYWPETKKSDSRKEFARNKFRILFRDSFRLMPSKLDTLAKEFKTKHQKLGDVDHREVTLENWTSEPLYSRLKQYHANDCMALLEVMEAFGNEVQKDYKIDVRNCVTVASLSKQSFWKNWYNPVHEMYTLPFDVDKFVRQSYFGGRCEAFFLGRMHKTCEELESIRKFCPNSLEARNQFYYYDFTSLYPFICQQNLPVGRPQYVDGSDVFDSNGKLRDDFYGFVKVRVSCQFDPNDHRIVKPLHGLVHNKRLTFPWFPPGQGVTMVLFSEEIRYSQHNLLPYRYEAFPQKCAVRFEKAPLLREMIGVCYEKKKQASIEGNEAKRLITKLLLNSAYGFWGLRTRDRDSITVVGEKDQGATFTRYLLADKLIGTGTQVCGDEKYYFLRVLRDLDTLDYNVAVAAAVTSLARVRLHMAIGAFENIAEGAKVFYVDTDSLITNVPIDRYPELLYGFQWDDAQNCRDVKGALLGNLKNEGDDLVKKVLKEQKEKDGGEVFFDRGWILGCKMYAVEKSNSLCGTVEISKCKGFSNRQGDRELQIDDFESLVSNMSDVNDLHQQFLDRKISLEQLRTETRDKVLHQTQTQFRTGKHSFLSEGAMSCSVELVDVEKFFRSNYTKGIVDRESGNILPLTVDSNDFFNPPARVLGDDEHSRDQLEYLDEQKEDEEVEDLEEGDVFDGDLEDSI